MLAGTLLDNSSLGISKYFRKPLNILDFKKTTMKFQATPTFITLALLATLAITSTVNTIFAQNMTGNMTAGNMTSGNMTETNQTGSVSAIKIHCGGTCLTEDN